MAAAGGGGGGFWLRFNFSLFSANERAAAVPVAVEAHGAVVYRERERDFVQLAAMVFHDPA